MSDEGASALLQDTSFGLLDHHFGSLWNWELPKEEGLTYHQPHHAGLLTQEQHSSVEVKAVLNNAVADGMWYC